jgi:hypothetical protein
MLRHSRVIDRTERFGSLYQSGRTRSQGFRINLLRALEKAERAATIVASASAICAHRFHFAFAGFTQRLAGAALILARSLNQIGVGLGADALFRDAHETRITEIRQKSTQKP